MRWLRDDSGLTTRSLIAKLTDMTNQHPFEKAGLGLAPFRCIGYTKIVYQACHGAPVQVGGSCAYCGTGIAHNYIVKSSDGKQFMVGCDCVEKTDLKLYAQLKEVRKAERLAVIASERAKRTEEELAKTLAKFPGLAEALKCDHPIVQSIAAKFAASKWISASQASLVIRLDEEKRMRDAQVWVADPPAVAVPVTDGRVKITGRIVCKKSYTGIYGTQYKMLLIVRTPEGMWKAWSTIPSALLGACEKGEIVSLKASIEISQDDPAFAFLKRPMVWTEPKPKARKVKAAVSACVPVVRPTFTQLLNMYRGAELLWARVDTRFHVYPARQPRQLALHNWEGWWLPKPDGTWYKSPSSYESAGCAHTPDLAGVWVENQITERCKLAEFLHADDATMRG